MKAAFSQYLAERFPVGPYLVLIGAMVVAATAAAADTLGAEVGLGWRQAVVTVTLLLGFFHLRVFDEHKDYDRDLIAHPDRVLSRGLVTLADLRRAAAVAIVAELLLSLALGWEALAWAGAFIAFSVAMRYEFGAGGWLNRHIVAYAVSHNPIVALMMMFACAVAAGGTTFGQPVVWFLLLATTTSLGFEIGRKVRAPEDEKEGQDTYTHSLGVPRASLLIVVLALLSLLVALPLLVAWWSSVAAACMAGAMVLAARAFARSPSARAAKAVENVTTLGALVLYVMVAADIMVRQGVALSS